MQQNRAHVRGALAQSLTFVLVFNVPSSEIAFLNFFISKSETTNWPYSSLATAQTAGVHFFYFGYFLVQGYI